MVGTARRPDPHQSKASRGLVSLVVLRPDFIVVGILALANACSVILDQQDGFRKPDNIHPASGFPQAYAAVTVQSGCVGICSERLTATQN